MRRASEHRRSHSGVLLQPSMNAKRRWEDQHWLWRGFQSAVFLYVSCGPCLAWQDHHRQKKQTRQDRKARDKQAKNYPDHSNLTRQPAPFEVNPHWHEEILLGPDGPKKGRGRGGTKASRETDSSGTLGVNDTAGSSLSDFDREKKDKHMFWNSKRYQRADEEYHYVDTLDEREEMIYAPPISRAGSSVGVSGWVAESAKMVKKPKKVYEHPSRAPPVNDLHPPVVSTVPVKKEERAWMTEPPPSAAFMHGKKGVTKRARSGSGNSSTRNLNAEPDLGRQVGHKIVEDKVKRSKSGIYGVQTTPLANRVDSKLQDLDNAASPTPIRHTSPTSSFRLAHEKSPSPSKKAKRRPPPLRLNTNTSAISTATSDKSDAEAEDSASSSESPTRKSRSRTKFQSITKSSRTSARPAALNSHPLTPTSRKDTGVTSPMTSAVSPGLSPSSTLQPEKESAISTPASGPPPVDNHTPSPKKRKDVKRATSTHGPNPLLVKDSSLNILQDLVDASALLNSKWVRSPVVEARIPLPPGDSPTKAKENMSPRQPFHENVKQELLMDARGRRWSYGI